MAIGVVLQRQISLLLELFSTLAHVLEGKEVAEVALDIGSIEKFAVERVGATPCSVTVRTWFGWRLR